MSDPGANDTIAAIATAASDSATLKLRAPNSYIRFWFESNFLSILKLLDFLEATRFASSSRPTAPTIGPPRPPRPRILIERHLAAALSELDLVDPDQVVLPDPRPEPRAVTPERYDPQAWPCETTVVSSASRPQDTHRRSAA